MERKHNVALTEHARSLRKAMTAEERRLWHTFLKRYPVRVFRQKVLGRYIVDFYCAKAKLVIEIDGSQHYIEEGPIADAVRTAYLKQFGVEVLRIPNNHVNLQFTAVCEHIDNEIRRRMELLAE